MSTANVKRPYENLHVKLDTDLARLVRIHRAETRETATDLVHRALRKALEQKPPKPAA